MEISGFKNNVEVEAIRTINGTGFHLSSLQKIKTEQAKKQYASN